MTDTSSNLRDLIITNNVQMITETGTLPSFSYIDHFPVFVSLNIEKPLPLKPQEMRIWDYSRTDINKLTSTLIQTDWNFIEEKNIHDATEQFTQTIWMAATDAIPMKIIKRRQDDKIWVTAELRMCMRKRDRLFRIAKQRQTTRDWSKWREQRNRTTTLNRQLKDAYIRRHIDKLLEYRQDPYRYHQTLKTLIGRRRHDVVPPLQNEDNEILTDNTQKADLMNNYFVLQTKTDTAGLALPETNDIDQNYDEAPPGLEQIKITENQVLNILNTLDVNKSTGPDKLPTKILKMIAILIVKPLTSLFNKSISSGTFPQMWKEATVTPVFKKNGSPSDIKQYRPISLLPCLSKILEKKMCSQFTPTLPHNLLSDKQSGYRPHHSAELQLTYLTHNIYKNLDQGRDVTAIYLDISKYFDKIWHKGLLFKCKNEFFISGALLSWLKSYLSDRRQKVRIGNDFSLTKTIDSGCPQGSVLGPLLALMYLNGLTKKVTNDILLYADDTSLYAPQCTQNADSVRQSLQRDLDAIYNYGNQWAISFNPAKTVQQFFTRKITSTPPALTFGGQPIPVTEKHKHLGLTFSKDLRFHVHTNAILKKMNKALSPIYPLAKFLTRSTLSNLYTTYIRPFHDYADVAFDGHLTTHDQFRLEKLQNRVARLTTGTPYSTSTVKLRLETGWESLKTRRELHRLTLFHKLTHRPDIQPDYIKTIIPQTRITDTQRNTRNAYNRTLPANNTTSFQRSFIPSTIRKWNHLPPTIRDQSRLSTFKRDIAELWGCSTPLPYFLFGKKYRNIAHTKIRTGTLPLNAYLHLIQKSESPACVCGFRTEHTKHFVLYCPLYQTLRNTMYIEISKVIQNFIHLSSEQMTDILLYGKSLNTGDGRRVAECFQSYIEKAMRIRLAAAAGGGVVARQ